MKQLFFNALIILLLLLPYHAHAGDGLAPVNFKGMYEMSFAGLPFGQLGAEIEQTPDHYDITADVTFTGILRLFIQHISHTTVDGTGQNFSYPNIVYETHYQTKKKKHYIKLEYKRGLLSSEEQIPPDPPGKRPVIPMEMKKDAADPVSIILKTRKMLWEAMQKKVGAFSTKLYDGNRLMQVDFTIVGKDTIGYGDKSLPVIKVMARRKLLAGYTPKELDDYDPKESPAYFYFSDDERLIPIRAETRFLATPLAATLVKECLPEESCLLGLKAD